VVLFDGQKHTVLDDNKVENVEEAWAATVA
jgi:hypothetical protein